MDNFRPESIDLNVLPSVRLKHRRLLPEVSCIYFALDNADKVQYIGRTNNLHKRWGGQRHHKYEQLSSLDNPKIIWLEISDSALLPDIEVALIQYFQPKLNRETYLGKGKTVITIYLTEKRKEKLRHYAELRGMNMSDLLNSFLDALPDLETSTKTEQLKALFQIEAWADEQRLKELLG